MSNRVLLTTSVMGILVVSMIGCAKAQTRLSLTTQTPAALSHSFALVELFTSEGCSSCPPADELLARINAQAKSQNLPVYTLAFHVDYWDRLGWTDPFSSADFTLRQQWYATSNAGGLYTPEMIVNGKDGFVGSDAQTASAKISAALSHSAAIDISLTATLTREHQVTVKYQLSVPAPGAVLNVALVARKISQNIPRGENAGRTLSHENVVVAFVSRKLASPNGETSLNLPPSMNNDNAMIVAYLQDPQSMDILAAASTDVK